MSKPQQIYCTSRDGTAPCRAKRSKENSDATEEENAAKIDCACLCRCPKCCKKNFESQEEETENKNECGQGIPTATTEGINICAAGPPPGAPEGWQLQYCNWSGWSWIKKSEEKEKICCEEEVKPKKEKEKREEKVVKKEKPPPCSRPKKKKKNWLQKCLCCQCGDDEPPPRTACTQYSRERVCYAQPYKVSEESLDCCNDCCNSGDCPDMCCDCLQELENQPRSSCNETQTEVKQMEQATSTFPLCPTKPPHIKKCCNCQKKFCCPCSKPPDNNNENTKSSRGPGNRNPNCCSNRPQNCCSNKNQKPKVCPAREIVNNRCLIDVQPNLGDFQNYGYPAELLLKNNENLMKMLSKKILTDEKISTFLDPNDKIESLQNNAQNREHCRLLTSVCEAILANKKAENLPEFQNRRDFKIEPETESIFDLDPDLALFRKNSFNDLGRFAKNDAAAVQGKVKVNREAGIQVDAITSNKIENGVQTKLLGGTVTKTMKSPRVKTQMKAPLMLKSGLFSSQELANFRGFKRALSLLSTSSNIERKLGKTEKFKSKSNKKFSGYDELLTRRIEKPSGDRFVSGLSEARLDSLTRFLESCRYDKPLDATSPPFTNLDLTYKSEESEEEKT